MTGREIGGIQRGVWNSTDPHPGACYVGQGACMPQADLAAVVPCLVNSERCLGEAQAQRL